MRAEEQTDSLDEEEVAIVMEHWERLERNNSIRIKRLNVVIEDLKQRSTPISAKVRRYKAT